MSLYKFKIMRDGGGDVHFEYAVANTFKLATALVKEMLADDERIVSGSEIADAQFVWIGDEGETDND